MVSGPLPSGPPEAAAIDADELARADLYGLLANLFHAPPPAALLDLLRAAATAAPVAGAFLERSWRDLVGAARRIEIEAIGAEYATLFLGIGKPEFFLYGSYHLAGTLNQQPLVELRDDLRRLGLERPEAVAETEDHLASLCEVMRYLIAGNDPAHADLVHQQRFFDAHLRGWAERLCEAIVAHPQADFYRATAAFAGDFFAIEAQAFDLLTAER